MKFWNKLMDRLIDWIDELMGRIKFLFFLKFLTFSVSQPFFEIPGVCRLPIAPGNCDALNTIPYGIRYGFDYDTKQCLPFNFCGNGGNGNNFFGRQDCLETCVNTQLLKPGGNRVGYPCETNLDCGKGAWCVL